MRRSKGHSTSAKTALSALATILLAFLLAAPAQADPPAHTRAKALDVTGLNHACGAAADTNGDLYASSAGESKVKVFDTADHATPIAQIANANEPCALAVTTTGNLYVSESATGNVVRYKPDAFPLTGAPVYGAAEPIHTGNAKGIAVDPFDNLLYVAAGNHIAVYKADGSLEKADVLEGLLTEATGVAAFTNPSFEGSNRRFNLAVADNSGDELEIFSGTGLATLKSRKVITGVDHDEDPGTAEQEFSFGAAGAYLAADLGNENPATDKCVQVQVGGQDQACMQGHFFLHDAGNDVLDEFDTTGEFFAQVSAAGLSDDAEPTQVAVERSGGAGDGTLYVGSGSGAGAQLLAFAPVFEPSRKPLGAPLSRVLASARAVATDCEGNVYVSALTTVRVFSPAGTEVTSFGVPTANLDIAVDCSGNVYVVPTTSTLMTYYSPSSNPPTGATTYTRHEPSLLTGVTGLQGVAVNPANDHVFVLGNQTFGPVIKEYGPPSGGSKAEGECGAGLGLANSRLDIDVYGKTGNVYVSANLSAGLVYVLKCGKEAADAEQIREVKNGGGCPSGESGPNPRIAVDQSNGHFVEFAITQPGAAAREYDALGACLAEFGTFSTGVAGYRLAIDNSCALHEPPLTEQTTPTCASKFPHDGNAYVAYDSSDDVAQPFQVNAFGPLEYPEVEEEEEPDPEEFTLKVSPAGSGTGTVTSSPSGISCSPTCEADFEEDTEVTLTGSPGANTKAVVWTGCDSVNGENKCLVTMDEAKEVTATFDLEQHLLSVTKTGSGTGKVSSSPPGIDCGSECSASFTHGTAVTLEADPDPGSTFTGWSGSGCSGTATCEVTMSAAKSVTAEFTEDAKPEFTLEVNPAGSGTGTVTSSPSGISCSPTCEADFEEDTEVTLTGSPGANSKAVVWTGCDSVNGENKCLVTMDEAKEVTATFDLEAHLLSVTKTGSGTGKVSSTPAGIDCGSGSECEELYEHGAVVTLSADPDPGSEFTGFSGACTGATCEVTMSSAKSVSANFDEESSAPKFLLSVDVIGTGSGTVTSDKGLIVCDPACSDEYEEGTAVVLTATPDPGSTFVGWKYCDKGGVAGRKCTLTMSKAKSLKATFTTTHDLEVSKAPGSGLGKVQSSPAGVLCLNECTETSAAFKEGTQVTLKQTPAKHFHFVQWSGDCTGPDPCVVTMGQDHEVQALFAEDAKHLLTLSKSGGGQGTVKSKPASINCGLTCSTQTSSFYQGQVVELTYTLGKGSEFGGWTGCDSEPEGKCLVTMSGAKGVTAEFK